MNKIKKFIKFSDRCKSPHAGSSTCCGCDPDFWLDDEPYKLKKDIPMEKFDAARLGFYKMRNGTIAKVFYVRKKNSNFKIMGVCTATENFLQWDDYGFYIPDKEHDLDLIEYIGIELPKEPREFKFEAYIEEKEIDYDKNDTSFYAIENAFKKNVSPLFVRKETEKCSKWEVTMKELLE
jgi:hypothetical protein